MRSMSGCIPISAWTASLLLRVMHCSVRHNYQVNVHNMGYHQIESSSEIEQLQNVFLKQVWVVC